MSKRVRKILRTNSEVIYELSFERREVSENLAILNEAIKAEPEAVSAHHKELWLERAENSTDLENELVSRRRCSKWMELAEKFKDKEAYYIEHKEHIRAYHKEWYKRQKAK